jgi:antitoxin component YwqK of YwqJK toxin-antitoxin module
MKATTDSVKRSKRLWAGVLGACCVLALLAGVALWNVDDGPAPALPEVLLDDLERGEEGLLDSSGGGLYSGMMITRYPDGQLRTRSAVRDGILHGLSEGWHPDGTPEVRETFVNGVSHGLRQRWYANGQLASQTEIRDGVVDGEFLRWHENGRLAQRIPMQAGQPHGTSEAWFPSGALQARVTLNNGTVIDQQYWKDGDVPAN